VRYARLALVAACVAVWAMNAATVGADAYPEPSGITDTTATTVCPPRPADDATTTDPDSPELVTVQQELSDDCAASYQAADQLDQWSEAGLVTQLAVGVVLIVFIGAVAVRVVWSR
jgi:hypothetical protein